MICYVHCEGGCVRCTFRRSYEDADAAPLMTAIQCTEPPSSAPSQTRQLLLNDGRQFVLTTASLNDSSVSAFPASASVTAAPDAIDTRVTANSAARTANDAEVPTDLALRDETPVLAAAAAAAAAVATDYAIPRCPVCECAGFASHVELNLHVNTHLDVEDTVG